MLLLIVLESIMDGREDGEGGSEMGGGLSWMSEMQRDLVEIRRPHGPEIQSELFLLMLEHYGISPLQSHQSVSL
jgi:hypothetical protein